jgi:hypothetical protein
MNNFRSKFEANFFKSLPKNSVTYESTILKYLVPESNHKYTPDFHIPGTNVYLELKGRLTIQDRKKMLLVIAQHPDKRIIMVFQDAKKPIIKGSKTTYALWADKNGVEWLTPKEAEDLIKLNTLSV